MSAREAPAEQVLRRVWPDLDQVVLRAAVVVGALVPLVAAQAAGVRPASWVQVLLLVLAVVHALRPESVAGIGVVLVVGYTWVLVPQSSSPLVLVAAAGLVLAHVAALLAAQGPARLRLDPVQVGRWSVRSVALLLAAVVVWALGVLMLDAPSGRLVYAGGLVLLTAVAVLAARLIGTRRDRL